MPFTWHFPELGLPGPRRALALAVLGFFGTIYLLTALSLEGAWMRPFVGLALCYYVAFFGVGAEWFWGRWFAVGIGWSGAMLALFALVMTGYSPIFAVYGLLHALIVVGLSGKVLIEKYEGQPAWRKRFDLEETAVTRLGRAVVRGGASLPSLILWALAPREEAGSLVALSLTLVGLAALLRARAWGALALGAAAGAAAITVAQGHVTTALISLAPGFQIGMMPPMLLPALLGFAFLPFARPLARFLRAR